MFPKLHGWDTMNPCRVHAAALPRQPSRDSTAVKEAGFKVLEVDTKTQKPLKQRLCTSVHGVLRDNLPASCSSGCTEHWGRCHKAMPTQTHVALPAQQLCCDTSAGAARRCMNAHAVGGFLWHPPRAPFACEALQGGDAATLHTLSASPPHHPHCICTSLWGAVLLCQGHDSAKLHAHFQSLHLTSWPATLAAGRCAVQPCRYVSMHNIQAPMPHC